MIQLDLTRLLTEYMVTGNQDLLTAMISVLELEKQDPSLQEGELQCSLPAETVIGRLRQSGYLQLTRDEACAPDGITLLKGKMLRVRCPDHSADEVMVFICADANLAQDNLLLIPLTGGQL